VEMAKPEARSETCACVVYWGRTLKTRVRENVVHWRKGAGAVKFGKGGLATGKVQGGTRRTERN